MLKVPQVLLRHQLHLLEPALKLNVALNVQWTLMLAHVSRSNSLQLLQQAAKRG